MELTDDVRSPSSIVCNPFVKTINTNKIILKTYKTGKLISDGATIVITGKPNAGKSSLFNSILSEKRALVSNTAGTTRDAVEVRFQIDGIPVNFVDTAGIRKKATGIEKKGIILTKRFLRIAKKENKLVHVWTIDDKEEMFKLIEFGVDGIMTDKPSVLKQAMTERNLF